MVRHRSARLRLSKSQYIARQAQRAVDEHGPDRVAIGSFTRAAAITIRDRDTHVNQDMVGTLHSWCYRAMGQPTIAEDKIKEWNEAHPLLPLSKRFDRADPLGVQGQGADRTFTEMQLLRAKLVPRRAWPLDVQEFGRKWDDWKEQNFYKDFTDLLEWGLNELDCAPGFPKVLFIDEAQDNNPLQHALVSKWAGNTDTTVLCGDPDQTIYSFAGSDPLAFYRASAEQKLYPPSLRQSYRVPRIVHDWARDWIGQIGERDPVDYQAKDEEGELIRANFDSRDGQAVAECVERYSGDGDVAILATCGYMLRPTISALRAAAVPFHNPYRETRGDWNPLKAISPRLLAFLRPCGAVWGNQARLWNGPELARWISTVRSKGVLRHDAKERVKEWKNQPRLDLADLYEVFEDGMLEEILNRMDDSLTAATQWLLDKAINDSMHKAIEYPASVLVKHGATGLLSEPRVIVGTGHSMKGGQAGTVICFPDLSPQFARDWQTEGPARDALVRLGYVMTTRPQHRLVLARGWGMW